MTCLVATNLRVVNIFQKTLTGGHYNESNYPVQELRWKRRGGLIFEGGVLAGHYGSVEDNLQPRAHLNNSGKSFAMKLMSHTVIPEINA